MSDLYLWQFFERALPSVQRRFAYDCADRAVREYAVHVLRSNNLPKEQATLSRIPEIRDALSAAYATDVVYGTARAIGGSFSADALRAVGLVVDSCDSDRPDVVAEAALNAVAACSYAAYGAVGNSRQEELDCQNDWIRKHWPRGATPTRATLAAVDAYIANGLLLREDE